ncbi:hypothetical protein P7L74_18940 [Tistrella mobilis]|uniref:calcium-binding protein n=1 Tax=Tistrella mobilis TaxID=171437 RepID=UPI00355719F4
MATIRGTSGSDRLAGTDIADTLYGLDGNDILDGGEGNDVYDGGNGNDTFLIWGDAGTDIFRGGAGTDTIRLADGTSTSAFVLGTKASVERIDFAGADLTGTDGDDVFDLRGVISLIGRRTIWLNDGDDSFTGSAAGDSVHGGTGDDRLDGGAGDDILEGGVGNDTLIGNDGNDRIVLQGRTGQDKILGGAGTDRLVIAGGTQVNFLSLTASASIEILRFEADAMLEGTSGRDTIDLSGVTAYENRQIIRLGSGVDSFTGSRSGDLVDGGNGDDRLLGGDGNDILEGGAGNDVLNGGNGNDIFRVQGAFGADSYAGGAGTDTLDIIGGAQTTSLLLPGSTSVEILRFNDFDLSGTDGDDRFDLSGITTITNRRTIWLNDGDDRFTGSRTVDDVHGGEGDDRLDGGAGNDIIEGGGGNDTLLGDSGNDIFRVQGDFGIDIIRGGTGTDTLQVVAGAETSSLHLNAAASVEILAFTDADLTGTDGNDSFDLSGVTKITNGRTIWLNAGNDLFVGSQTVDRIHGGAGNDRLQGGKGADILTGGTGRDTFAYTATSDSTVAATGRDRIEDFSQAQGDQIDLSALDAITGTSGNQAFTYIGSAGFSGKGGEVRVAVVTSGVLVYADLDGDKSSDMSILVAGITSLTAADFIL